MNEEVQLLTRYLDATVDPDHDLTAVREALLQAIDVGRGQAERQAVVRPPWRRPRALVITMGAAALVACAAHRPAAWGQWPRQSHHDSVHHACRGRGPTTPDWRSGGRSVGPDPQGRSVLTYQVRPVGGEQCEQRRSSGDHRAVSGEVVHRRRADLRGAHGAPGTIRVTRRPGRLGRPRTTDTAPTVDGIPVPPGRSCNTARRDYWGWGGDRRLALSDGSSALAGELEASTTGITALDQLTPDLAAPIWPSSALAMILIGPLVGATPQFNSHPVPSHRTNSRRGRSRTNHDPRRPHGPGLRLGAWNRPEHDRARSSVGPASRGKRP